MKMTRTIGTLCALMAVVTSCLASHMEGAEPTGLPWSTGTPFRITMDIKVGPGFKDGEVASLPGVVSIRLFHQNPTQRDAQNYAASPTKQGTVPVVEAILKMRLPGKEGEDKSLVVGTPLGALKKSWGKHRVELRYTGVRWTMYMDGRLTDNDFAIGAPAGDVFALPVRHAETVGNVKVEQYDGQGAATVAGKARKLRSAQYFTPEGHNAWVGDVVTFFHRGRYHVFYLYDRRGHQSKMGRGGHYFEHLSTKDFRIWTEHEAAIPIEKQWETLGTGTPFVFGDSLYLAYGLHSSRIVQAERTSTPGQWKWIEEKGESQCIDYDTLSVVPSGTSYAVSADGVARFRKSHRLIHPCENPTIYTGSDGKLTMLANYGARGTWTSDRVDGGWRCEDEQFPPGGDCTFPFSWGGYDYIVGGFTHLWMKPTVAPRSAFKDMVAEGLDCYDGLSVPCVTEIAGGRRLWAGWMELNQHWGGLLVVREMVQKEDGRLGTRWMPEMMPKTGRAKRLGKPEGECVKVDDGNFLLTFRVRPSSAGSVTVDFLPEDEAGEVCTWTVWTGHRRAQFSGGGMAVADPNNREKTLREGGAPQRAVNYAVENLEDVDDDFSVRIIGICTDKLGGTVVDVEIAGARTMISYRKGLRVERLRLCTDMAEVYDVALSSVKS